MATITSIDKQLGRASSLTSFAAFAGLLALAFLPARGVAPVASGKVAPTIAAEQGKKSPSATPAAAAPTPPSPAVPDPAVHQQSTAPAPPAAAPAPGAASPAAPGTLPPATPPPDVWTPTELAAGLRQCVQLLAPATVEVAMEEPMKHGACGTPAPLALHSAGSAEKVVFDPAPTLNCRLAASLSEWVDKVLQPAAREVLGSRITRIVGASSYSCRNIYNNPKLTLSEHATGNAIDIAGFVTADGRTVMVSKTWGPTERDIVAAKKKIADEAAKKRPGNKDKPAETPDATPTPSIEDAGKRAEAKKASLQKTGFKRAAEKPADAATPGVPVPATTKEATFLKKVHASSCTVFATVLGPEANEAHRDHFHLDMKVRQSSHAVCH